MLIIGNTYKDKVTETVGVLTRITQYAANYSEGTLEGRSNIGPWTLSCASDRLVDVEQSATAPAPAPVAPANTPAPAAPAPASTPLSDDRRSVLYKAHVVEPGAALVQKHANKVSRIHTVLKEFGITEAADLAKNLHTEAEVLAEYSRFIAACTKALEAA